MSHTCLSCGAVADDAAQLCNPTDLPLHCDYCGEHNVSANHVCKQKLAAMKFSCSSCGKVAEEEVHLCNPQAIG